MPSPRPGNNIDHGERVTHRDEWSPAPDARHQLEAREHSRVSHKRETLRAATSREARQQMGEIGGR